MFSFFLNFNWNKNGWTHKKIYFTWNVANLICKWKVFQSYLDWMTPSPQKWSLKPRERQNRRKLRFRRRITAKRSARGEWYISKEMSASKSWTLMKKCPKSLNRLRHPLKGQKTKIFWKIVKNRAFGGAYRPNGSPVADNA